MVYLADSLIEKMRRCRLCGETKSINDFHFKFKKLGMHQKECKVCRCKAAHQYHSRGATVIESTAVVRYRLRTAGIACDIGYKHGMPWADLCAWGCVPIEAKMRNELKDRHGAFQFGFGGMGGWNQLDRWEDGILVLVPILPSGERVFLIIPMNDPMLFHSDGDRKMALGFVVDSMHGHARNWDRLRVYRDAFSHVEAARIRYSERLRWEVQ